MNGDYEKRLASEIDKVLRDLSELEAPGPLVGRVMIHLEERSVTIWYRRSWQTWSGELRVAVMIALVALFVGLCYSGLELSHTGIASATGQRVGEWFSGFSAITNTLKVLLNSMCLVVQNFGTGFVIACLFAIGLGYVVCVGLGTLYLRLAFTKT